MHPKRFVIIFITYVYTIDIPVMGSHRDSLCFCMIDYGENGYLHSNMWAKMTEN